LWAWLRQACSGRRFRALADKEGERKVHPLTHFGHSVADIAHGADSVFLSFYKGSGSTSGSWLPGSADFIRQARIWIRRFGGNLYQIYGLAVPARLNYAKQVARFPDYVAKARSITALLHNSFDLQILPYPVKTNMFHVVLPVAPDLLKARLDAWSDAKLNLPIWTDASPAGMSRSEFTVGESVIPPLVTDLLSRGLRRHH
jgi:threonine aldolase